MIDVLIYKLSLDQLIDAIERIMDGEAAETACETFDVLLRVAEESQGDASLRHEILDAGDIRHCGEAKKALGALESEAMSQVYAKSNENPLLPVKKEATKLGALEAEEKASA